MGMQVRIVLYAPNETIAVSAATAAFAEIARLDAVLSDHLHDSELRRAHDGAGPTRVSEDLFVVIERALRLARQTDGRFDPTAGALSALWREAIVRERLPAPAEIERARALGGYEHLTLDPVGRTVRIERSGLRLDLGGIAKGYVLDRAIAVLDGGGHERVLVEAGGDIVASGAPPSSRGWRVRIEHLRAPHDQGCSLHLANAAISTSGDREQFLDVGDRRYSHTVDPHSGLGLSHRRAATVVAVDGITADGLATALTLVEEDRVNDLLALYPDARAIRSPADCVR